MWARGEAVFIRDIFRFLLRLVVKHLTEIKNGNFNILSFLSRQYCIQLSRQLLQDTVYFSDVQLLDPICSAPDKALGVWASTVYKEDLLRTGGSQVITLVGRNSVRLRTIGLEGVLDSINA